MKGTHQIQPQPRHLCHQLLLTLLLSCLMLQALIPHGYMPGDLAAGEGALVFCGLELNDDPDQVSPQDQDSHYQAESHNLCTFTTFAQSATLSIPDVSNLYTSAITTGYTGYDPPLGVLQPTYSLPPSRAPPAS
ncbi:hypothetical protein [Hahella ganghwensis]|uniref:hypothetical protein n=1 Tax=Hahella ganghwensis TaxID=286420 RepID=UPI000376499C|nr:hypothetical protein [Hahella ganghwensis]